ATAIKLAENGYRIIITGRRKKLLDKFTDYLKNKFGEDSVYKLNFDIRSKEAVENAINSLPEKWESIDLLVNNAGLAAGAEPINEGIVDNWEQMIDTNIKGLLYITRLISPDMVKRGNGHIINIGSIAGKEVYANGNTYCATKYAVDALTKGMRIDFLKYGIKVSSVCPGAVETEFSYVRYKWDKEKADKVYEGFTPLYAEDIAEAVLFVASRPEHVNINDILIMPTAQANANNLHKKNN
ncbi:SDR family NAD(P)-dependent oxidoreductase, partial [Bacteroidota bacterium]